MGITLANNAHTTLSADASSIDTTIYVDDVDSFPALDVGDYFYLTLERTSGAQEIVKVTQINAASFTVVRGQESTIPISFPIGSSAKLNMTVQNITDLIFTGSNVNDGAYGVDWDGDTTGVPTRNAVYDKFESLAQNDINGLTTADSVTFTNLSVLDTVSAVAGLVAGDLAHSGLAIMDSPASTGAPSVQWKRGGSTVWEAKAVAAGGGFWGLKNTALGSDSLTISATDNAATFAGNVLFSAGNTYDIGALGTTSARNIYASTKVVPVYLQFQAGGALKSYMQSSTDGIIGAYNAAGNDFTRLQFGGTTSSFPALARSGSGLAAHLADGSDTTGLTVAALVTSGGGLASNALQRGSGLQLGSTNGIRWSSDTTYNGTADLFLYRDAANVLALRNSTNAQAFRVYNTYTDASNYERLTADFSSGAGAFRVMSDALGTGTYRALTVGTLGTAALNLSTNNTTRWHVNGSTGYLLAGLDATYDIGASGATRPRNIYVSSKLSGAYIADTGGTNRFDFTTANSIGWFGSTSSYPALKRSSTILQARLADDSAYTDIEVLDTPYGVGWDGSNKVPTQNAIYDKIQSLGVLADGDKGDITVSASGATWTIDANTITLAKMANMATASLIYRKTAGTGAPEVNTLATLKTDLGLTGTNSGDQTITLTGNVTGSGTGSFATTIANNAVTLAKMATMATASILGRTTAATGNVEVLTSLPWAFTGDVTRPANSNVTTIANNVVSSAKFRQSVARSVVGVTGNATANVADIQGTANQFLQVNSAGTALAFTTMSGDVTLTSGVAALATAAITGRTQDTAPEALNDFVLTYDNSATALKKVLLKDLKTPECITIAVGDETTAITTGTAKVTWRMPYAFTVTAVRSSVNTVSSSGLPTVDINESGVSILSTTLSIDASEKTSTTAATAAVISDTSLADDAEMTIDIDTAGTGAKGLKVQILGYRT